MKKVICVVLATACMVLISAQVSRADSATFSQNKADYAARFQQLSDGTYTGNLFLYGKFAEGVTWKDLPQEGIKLSLQFVCPQQKYSEPCVNNGHRINDAMRVSIFAPICTALPQSDESHAFKCLIRIPTMIPWDQYVDLDEYAKENNDTKVPMEAWLVDKNVNAHIVFMNVINGQSNYSNFNLDDLLYQRPDTDADTIPDAVDNCIDKSNEDQKDTDKDGVGDACEGFVSHSNLQASAINDDLLHASVIKQPATATPAPTTDDTAALQAQIDQLKQELADAQSKNEDVAALQDQLAKVQAELAAAQEQGATPVTETKTAGCSLVAASQAGSSWILMLALALAPLALKRRK